MKNFSLADALVLSRFPTELIDLQDVRDVNSLFSLPISTIERKKIIIKGNDNVARGYYISNRFDFLQRIEESMTTMQQSSKKLALVIGNNDYEDEGKLNCSINDALDVGNELEKIGFLVTIGINLPYMKMMQTILQFQRQIDKDDLVIFFFSGHGAQWEDQNYLIPTDNKCLSDDLEMYRYHAVRVQLTIESMIKRQPCAVIVLLDCCRDYLVENQALSSIPLTKSVQEHPTVTNMTTSMRGVAGSMIAYACGPDGSILEESKNGRNSMFTYHLLKHIAEPNLKVDEMMCRVCNGVFEDTDGKCSSHRLSSLRTPNVYFNTTEKG